MTLVAGYPAGWLGAQSQTAVMIIELIVLVIIDVVLALVVENYNKILPDLFGFLGMFLVGFGVSVATGMFANTGLQIGGGILFVALLVLSIVFRKK